MANEQDKNPTTGQEPDISKAQATQQPTGQDTDSEQTGDQAATGQTQSDGSPDEALQGDTLAQQRTDIEGNSQTGPGGEQPSGGFVGSQGKQDSSSELVDEDDEDFAKGGQGAPEGK